MAVPADDQQAENSYDGCAVNRGAAAEQPSCSTVPHRFRREAVLTAGSDGAREPNDPFGLDECLPVGTFQPVCSHSVGSTSRVLLDLAAFQASGRGSTSAPDGSDERDCCVASTATTDEALTEAARAGAPGDHGVLVTDFQHACTHVHTRALGHARTHARTRTHLHARLTSATSHPPARLPALPARSLARSHARTRVHSRRVRPRAIAHADANQDDWRHLTGFICVVLCCTAPTMPHNSTLRDVWQRSRSCVLV